MKKIYLVILMLTLVCLQGCGKKYYGNYTNTTRNFRIDVDYCRIIASGKATMDWSPLADGTSFILPNKPFSELSAGERNKIYNACLRQLGWERVSKEEFARIVEEKHSRPQKSPWSK